MALVGGASAMQSPLDTVKQDRPSAMDAVVIVKYKAASAGKFDQASLHDRLQVVGQRPLFEGSTSSYKHYGTTASQAQLEELQQIYELRYTADVPPHLAAAWLAQDPSVEYAEPRYIYHLTEINTDYFTAKDAVLRQEPNDPQFANMVHLQRVELPAAWDLITAESGSVTIAIVDAGTDWRHDDLIGNVWTNPAETDNNVDDDGNGRIDDLRGWNFANNSNDPTGLSNTPSNGRHGTIVAGIAAAVTNNQRGIAGASWNAKFIPVNTGCPNTDSAVCFGYEGVLYAASVGADIINVSWGGPDSFFGRDVIRAVTALGALVVVSAGNNGSISGVGGNIDINTGYPASYDDVLVVGSTNKNDDVKARFSNFGLSVDLFAPGVNIESTIPNNDYTAQASGTSFATPIVSALAALLKTYRPELSMAQVGQQIRVTSDAVDDVNPPDLQGFLGHGRANALRALTVTDMPAVRIRDIEIMDSGGDGAVQNRESVDIILELTNFLADARNLSVTLSSPDTSVAMLNGIDTIGLLETGAIARAQFSFRMRADVPTDYAIRFRLAANGTDYEDAEFFQLTVNQATHQTGLIEMSITDEGNIGWAGFQEMSAGKGFQYFGVDWLYEGGLMVATGPSRISDSVRNTREDEQDEDFVRAPSSFFGIIDGTVSSEIGVVNIVDEAAANPIGIKVHQESFADTTDAHNDFVVMRYRISHADPQQVSPIDNLYVALFTDWDLTNGRDFARFDASRRLGMVQSSAVNPIVVFGAKRLTEGGELIYRSIDNQDIYDSRSDGDGFTNDEKWAFLSGGVQVESVDNEDVSTLIGAGPFQLIPGREIEVAFALIATTGIEEMESAADEAQLYWDETLSLVPPSTVAIESGGLRVDGLSVQPPFPNPMRSATTFAFEIPRPGPVDLSIYDILGRKVKTIFYEATAPGRHTISWDGTTEEGRAISNGMYLCRISMQHDNQSFVATEQLLVLK